MDRHDYMGMAWIIIMTVLLTFGNPIMEVFFKAFGI